MRILIIGTILFSLMLSGCSLIPMPKIVKPKDVIVTSKNREEKLYKETGYEELLGKARKFTRYYKDYSSNQEKTVPKKTLMERVGNWISGLSFLAFILIGAGLFFFPTITISILWSVKCRVGRALRETVSAIKISQAVNRDTELHNQLAFKQTKQTKKMIGNIKANL